MTEVLFDCSKNLHDFPQFLKDTLKYWADLERNKHFGQASLPLTKSQVSQMVNLLQANFRSVPSMRLEMQSITEKMLELSEEQYDVVEMMNDKHLDSFSDEVIKVIYSKDKSMRYVFLKDEKGVLTYHLEVIYQFDVHEWQYVCSDDDAPPATWGPYPEKSSNSLFVSEGDLMRELEFEPEYRQYFV